MTAAQAIEKLEEMQKQIIHGSRIFSEIAEVIREQGRQAEQARKLLGYDDGDLLNNVTRFHAYATAEIEGLRRGSERLLNYTARLERGMPEQKLRKLQREALKLKFSSAPSAKSVVLNA